MSIRVLYKWTSLLQREAEITKVELVKYNYHCVRYAPHSSTPAWKIPWTEEPGRLQSMGSLGVGHDWATSLSLFTFMHWRRKWQPTPVFLPGESQGTGEPGGLPSLGWHRVGHNWSDSAAAAAALLLGVATSVRSIQTSTVKEVTVKFA